MPTIADNNRRIAKNTLFLYMRMLLIMAVTIYTSRVVLNALGVVDYGVYNVVGGMISIMAFLNGSMGLATQRFLAYDIGDNNPKKLRITFSTAINIHLAIAIISAILAETVGLWFFWKYLNIPPEARQAALWVYHLSIIQMMLGIMVVPLSALAVAHEKMQAYAYFSVVEAVIKLAVAFFLTYIAFNKLVLYGILLLAAQTITFSMWGIYCHVAYKQCRYTPVWDKGLFQQMLSFAGWQTLGTATWMIRTQGINLVMNVFFGPVANAARGIAVQVNSAVTQFVSNFQLASNPQITKFYAAGQNDEMRVLIMRSSRFSFLLIFVLALPVLIETEAILKLWLGIVPEYSVIFVRLILVSTLAEQLSGTLVYGVLATGHIRKYQSVICSILISEIFFAWGAYKIGYPPQTVFYIEITLYLIALVARMWLGQSMLGLSMKAYAINVLRREGLVIVSAVTLSFTFRYFMPDSTSGMIVTLFGSFIIAVLCTVSFGITRNERAWGIDKLTSILHSLTK